MQAIKGLKQRLKEEVEELDAGLIAVGRRELGDIKRAVMGSVLTP